MKINAVPLEEIEKKLYREEFERKKREEKARPEPGRGEEAGPRFESWEREAAGEPVARPKFEILIRPPKNWRRLILIFSFALFLVLVGGGLYFWYVYFPQNKVEITFSGPKEVRAGETATYLFRYRNNTKTILRDAEVTLRYPQGVVVLNGVDTPPAGGLPFVKKSLGNVGIGSEAEETFPLLFFGEPPITKRLEASISYTPANLPRSRLENKGTLDVAISALTLNVDLALPNRILAGEPFVFNVNYRNNSDFTFPDSRIIVDWPDNFVFLDSDLKPSQGGNVWFLGTLGAYSEGKIEIKGVISGEVSQAREFKARIGIWRLNDFLTFRETTSSVFITGLPLTLSSVINNSADYIVKPGEVLNFRIAYKNTGDIGLREVVLRTEFTGSMFDFRTVEVEGGSFSSRDNAITWNAGSWPAFSVLEPGEEGEVAFRIRVKSDYPVSSSADKNFVLKAKSTLTSPTVPAYLGLTLKQISVTGEVAARVRTELRVLARGYFRDPQGVIRNSGPLPPKVGEVTTYTAYWFISNPANDAENVMLRTTLPAGISWTGEVRIPFGSASPVYNDRTGEVIWSIGRISAGAGITSPAYQAYFQVAAVPSVNQIGNLISIINETEFSGQDIFTGVDLSGKSPEVRSNLPDDPTVSFQQGIVVE